MNCQELRECKHTVGDVKWVGDKYDVVHYVSCPDCGESLPEPCLSVDDFNLGGRDD